MDLTAMEPANTPPVPTTDSDSDSNEASRLEQFRGSADAYGVVLILLIAVFALPGLTPEGTLQRVLVAGSACSSAVLGLYVSRIRGWAIGVAVAISIVSVLIAARGARLDDADLAEVMWGVSLGILLIVSPAAIANRIARHKIVTFRTVLGAICIYLQIALAFSFFFHAIEAAQPDSLNGLETGQFQYMYFSVVTMTTLGYGDITPVSDLARSAAMIETVLGQVFLVVVVARVVSMVGTDRTLAPEKADQTRQLHRSLRRHGTRSRVRRLIDGAGHGDPRRTDPGDAEEHPDGLET